MSERLTRTIARRLAGLIAAGSAVAMLAAAGSAAAQSRQLLLRQVETAEEALAPEEHQLFPAQRGGVSLAEATRMAQSRFPGRVLRAEKVTMGDRVVYEIRILDAEGVVRNVRIDAQTGSFL